MTAAAHDIAGLQADRDKGKFVLGSQMYICLVYLYAHVYSLYPVPVSPTSRGLKQVPYEPLHGLCASVMHGLEMSH